MHSLAKIINYKSLWKIRIDQHNFLDPLRTLVQEKTGFSSKSTILQLYFCPSKYKKVPCVTHNSYFQCYRANHVILFIVEVQQMEKGSCRQLLYCHSLLIFTIFTSKENVFVTIVTIHKLQMMVANYCQKLPVSFIPYFPSYCKFAMVKAVLVSYNIQLSHYYASSCHIIGSYDAQ